MIPFRLDIVYFNDGHIYKNIYDDDERIAIFNKNCNVESPIEYYYGCRWYHLSAKHDLVLKQQNHCSNPYVQHLLLFAILLRKRNDN